MDGWMHMIDLKVLPPSEVDTYLQVYVNSSFPMHEALRGYQSVLHI